MKIIELETIESKELVIKDADTGAILLGPLATYQQLERLTGINRITAINFLQRQKVYTWKRKDINGQVLTNRVLIQGQRSGLVKADTSATYELVNSTGELISTGNLDWVKQVQSLTCSKTTIKLWKKELAQSISA